MFGYISYNIKVLKAQQECLSHLFLKVFFSSFVYLYCAHMDMHALGNLTNNSDIRRDIFEQ